MFRTGGLEAAKFMESAVEGALDAGFVARKAEQGVGAHRVAMNDEGQLVVIVQS
jgi:hypothetical protein